MSVLSEDFITTQDLILYIKEKHGRHWSRQRLYSIIMNKKIAVYKRIGRQNIYKISDIDNYVNILTRKSSSGMRGIKYGKATLEE